jgi:hypothetical protein
MPAPTKAKESQALERRLDAPRRSPQKLATVTTSGILRHRHLVGRDGSHRTLFLRRARLNA